VLAEHARRPNTPIYLIGDSFGGSLSLAVAARNPNVDLVLVLANPGELCYSV
jgi:pimeloyl-ACP methyl ester carboxylesterase